MATKLIQGQLFNAAIKGLVTPNANWYDKDATIKYMTCSFESTSAVGWAKVSTQDSDYEVYASYDGSETISINIIADASDFSSDNPLRLYLNADSSGMFYYFGALEDIFFFTSTLETSSVPVILLWDMVTNIVTTNPLDDMMAGMFEKCASLKNFSMVSTEYWDYDTAVLGISSLAKMFFDCQSLKSCSICLNKEQDNTALVTNVLNMFYHCEELESVVLVGNFSGVRTGANNMFYGCESLYKFTVPSGMANLSLPYYTDWSTEEGTDVVYARFGFLKNSDSDFSNVYSDLASKTVPNDLPSDYKWARKATLLDIYLDFEASTPYDTDIIFELQDGISEPAKPTKEGYTFEGWYASDKVTPFDFTQTFTGLTLKDIEVYANWVVADLTVTFDSQGGSPVAPVMVASGYKVVKPANPIKEGYIFKDWYTDTTFTTKWNFNDVVKEDMTLYALWAKSWTVTFVTNGGTAVAPRVVESGQRTSQPSNYRIGFTKVGWYTDTTYTTAFNFSTPITEDITLYELWKYNNINHKETFIMTADWTAIDADEELERYDIHNDYGFMYKNVSTNEIHPESPESPDFVVDGQYVLDADNSYTYEIYNKTDRYVVDVNDPNVVYQRLVGGNIEDFSYIDYQVTQKTTGGSSLGYTTTATIKPIPVRKTVTFDSNGGSSVEQEIILRGTLLTEPTAPTKEHYNFGGWFKESDCINEWDFDTDTVTEDITLYAKFTVQTFTVTFNSEGGTQVSPYTSVEYGSKITEPSTPEKLENDFDGWYKDSEFETAWDFENDTVTENITLYAKWIKWSKSRIFNHNAYRGKSLKSTRGNKVRREFRPFR